MEVLGPLPCEPTQEGIVSYMEAQVKDHLQRWQQAVAEEPERFAQVEVQILDLCRKLAGPLTAAVLGAEAVQRAVERRAEQLRSEAPKALRKVEYGPRWVKLLCGWTLNALCWYCAPRRDPSRPGPSRGVGRRGKEPVGLYPEWAALGIREGASPQLQSEAARLVALLPSIRLARAELEQRGCRLDEKSVRRIALEVGGQALARRKEELERFRAGLLPAGTALRGKRVAIAIDGGKARTRVNKGGRRTKNGRHCFNTPWREPKLLVIYVLDAQGRIDHDEPVFIEVTLLGADALMELAAYHLHRLGAAEAKEGIFLGDGAEWIWDRVDAVMKLANLPQGRWRRAVDLSHVVGHLSDALEACKHFTSQQRARRLSALKKELRRGNLSEVIRVLRSLCRGRRSQAIRAEINYLQKRWDRLQYGLLRRKRLPIGSGAVESSIRRVLNLRIKGPGIFWHEENLEKVAYLRAQVLSGRWNEMMAGVWSHAQRTRLLTWRWKPTPMTQTSRQRHQPSEISHDQAVNM